MPIEDLDFYSAPEAGRPERDLSLDVLSLNLVRQLGALVWRVLRESGDVDGDSRIARLYGEEIVDGTVEGRRRIALYLIENDGNAAERSLFWFDASGGEAPSTWLFHPESPPDLWYNMAIVDLRNHLDARASRRT
jgi:hypothetical protein